ncbi:MAG: hypothetical protein AAF668_09070 [Pseudomonadota bacterium]
MWINDSVQFIVKEWGVISQAPTSLAISIGLSGLVIWRVLAWRYNGIIEIANAKIASQSERLHEYQQKLDVQTPDEAKERVAKLEARLDALEPRRISAEQRSQMLLALNGFTGSINVVHDMGWAEARPIANSIASTFQAAGWLVQTPSVMGPTNPPISGIRIKVKNLDALSPEESAAIAALEAAGLSPEKRDGYHYDILGMQMEILVTARSE